MSFLEQGDIIEIDSNPSVGHEPAKRRPATVITGYGFNSRSSLVGVAPVQTTDSNYPMHVPVDGDDLHGFACVEMARTIDVEQRGYKLVGQLDDKTLGRIMSLVRSMYSLR